LTAEEDKLNELYARRQAKLEYYRMQYEEHHQKQQQQQQNKLIKIIKNKTYISDFQLSAFKLKYTHLTTITNK